jgi:hypothetical protein
MWLQEDDDDAEETAAGHAFKKFKVTMDQQLAKMQTDTDAAIENGRKEAKAHEQACVQIKEEMKQATDLLRKEMMRQIDVAVEKRSQLPRSAAAAPAAAAPKPPAAPLPRLEAVPRTEPSASVEPALSGSHPFLCAPALREARLSAAAMAQ